MNLQNLRNNHPKLISYMEQNGYSERYIRKIRSEITWILLSAEAKSWLSYKDIYLEYVHSPSDSKQLHDKLACLSLINNFDLYNQYPDRHQRRQKIVPNGKYHLLTDEYKAVIDFYRSAEKSRKLKESTIGSRACNGSSFFYNLQQNGIASLEGITEKAVQAVFASPECGSPYGYSCKKSIEAVFRACIPYNSDAFTKILTFLPALRETRRNIQYLQPEEVTQLKQALVGEGSPLSLRDKAIGTLALYTGLRCSDISTLTLDAVDLENDQLHICQQKTGVPLELPLTAVVGNAIYDYLQLERPDTMCKYVFVTFKSPHQCIKNISGISRRIMKVAGIRQLAGDRAGFHVFRHHLATQLLSNDVPQPVISKVMGHTSPDSLEVYLSTDFKHLKECALSIERFPVRKGVWGDE